MENICDIIIIVIMIIVSLLNVGEIRHRLLSPKSSQVFACHFTLESMGGRNFQELETHLAVVSYKWPFPELEYCEALGNSTS